MHNVCELLSEPSPFTLTLEGHWGNACLLIADYVLASTQRNVWMFWGIITSQK